MLSQHSRLVVAFFMSFLSICLRGPLLWHFNKISFTHCAYQLSIDEISSICCSVTFFPTVHRFALLLLSCHHWNELVMPVFVDQLNVSSSPKELPPPNGAFTGLWPHANLHGLVTRQFLCTHVPVYAYMQWPNIFTKLKMWDWKYSVLVF